MLILISILLTYLCIIKTLDFLVSINFNKLHKNKEYWQKVRVYELDKGRLIKNFITSNGNLREIVLIDFRTKNQKQQQLEEYNKQHGLVEQEAI